MRQVFADTMLEIGQRDPKLVVVVGDISHGLLQPFAKACPGRYFNIGIMEQAMVSISAGLSLSGLHPVTHTIAPFLIDRCYEQLKLDFGYQGLGGVMVGVGGAFDYSQLGCSHHSYAACQLVKTIPGSQVFAPASPNEFKKLFAEVYQQPTLSYFHLPSTKHGLDIPAEAIELGKPIRIREGSGMTIIAVGPQLRTALDADVPEAEIIYVHTLKPMDDGIIKESVAKTKRMLWLEEAGMQKFQHGYGSRQEHLRAVGLTAEMVRGWANG